MPPYSSAKDLVNMAGFVAENANGVVVLRIELPGNHPDAVILDVSEGAER